MIDKKWIGHELPTTQLTLERGRLRFFAKAIGETDAVYSDVAAAQAAGYADLPAPPTFLFGADLDAGALEQMLALLEIPLPKVLHGEQNFTHHLPVCAGETVTVRSRVADIFDKKNGALEFVIKLSQVRKADGALAAELRSVIVVRH